VIPQPVARVREFAIANLIFPKLGRGFRVFVFALKSV
jgi:hypothetical protein